MGPDEPFNYVVGAFAAGLVATGLGVIGYLGYAAVTGKSAALVLIPVGVPFAGFGGYLLWNLLGEGVDGSGRTRQSSHITNGDTDAQVDGDDDF